MADHRNALALGNAKLVEPGGQCAGAFGHFLIRDRSPGFSRLVRFINYSDSVGVDQFGATDEIVDGKSDLHGQRLFKVNRREVGRGIMPQCRGRLFQSQSGRPGLTTGPLDEGESQRHDVGHACASIRSEQNAGWSRVTAAASVVLGTWLQNRFVVRLL